VQLEQAAVEQAAATLDISFHGLVTVPAVTVGRNRMPGAARGRLHLAAADDSGRHHQAKDPGHDR